MKRNNERIQLPNGCECSQLNVTPKNWETSKADITKPWVISYRFYSPSGSKPVQVRGMNDCHNLIARQEATKNIIDTELDLLINKGYNPILDSYIAPPIANDDNDYLIHPEAEFANALQRAFELFEGNSKTDLKSSLKFIQLSVRALNFHGWPVKDIKKRHLIRILENCKKVKEMYQMQWSSNQYNHYRTALLSLYKILVKCETVETNLVHGIDKKHHAAEPRQALTKEQRRLINYRLKINNFRFWNFIHIFFHSGARLTEMSRVQGKHVDIERQQVAYLVKKGKTWEWVIRPMPDESVPFWRRALIGCGPDQYVFSKSLLPGDVSISSKQYTRRWKTWIISPVADEETKFNPKGKKARNDFMRVHLYDLKHTRTTELGDIIENDLAEIDKAMAKANGHTTTKMAKTVYDLKNKGRKDEKIKSAGIKFA